MPTYLLYPRRADGSCLTFEAAELASDADALLEARHVLQAHPSAVEVVIWEGERRLGGVTQRSSAEAQQLSALK